MGDLFLERSYRNGYRWVIQYVDRHGVWNIAVHKTAERAQKVLDKALAAGRPVGSHTPTALAAPSNNHPESEA